MNIKQLAEMVKRIRQEKLDEIVVNPNNDTPAGRAARKAMKDNQGKPALPLQAGQRLSPIGDKSRGRVVKTTNRFVPKRPVSAPLDANRNAALDNPTTQSPMALAQRRQDAANAVRAGRVGDPGKQNFVQNARAEAQRRREAGEPVLKAKDVPGLNKDPKAVAAAQQRSNEIMANAKTGGQPLIKQPVDMRGGSGDYRTAQTKVKPTMSGGAGDYRDAQTKNTAVKTQPIKVTDTEVMNSPEYKKAVKSVGGEAGARNIQVGQRVQGLGSFNKGDTIMDRTRTQLAAKKNVGRES